VGILMAKYTRRSLRLASPVQFCAALLAGCVLTGSALAQMSKPNPEAYDTPPVLIHQDLAQSVHQEFVQSAAIAHQENEPAVLILLLSVDVHGLPSHVRVVRATVLGRDEKTVELVRNERFKPALKDGTPVMATIYLKVTFDSAVN
jgi:Gram-negative bacterial TonB protein C-terminal